MARGLNRAEIIGHLGDDPDVRYTNNDQAVASLSVATSEQWTDKDGERQEKTEWHRVTIWGKLAEIAKEYLRKGSRVYLAGKLSTEKYEDKDGVTRYTTKIIANELVMLDGKSDDSRGGDRGNDRGGDRGNDRGSDRGASRGRDSSSRGRDSGSRGRDTGRSSGKRRETEEPNYDDDIPF